MRKKDVGYMEGQIPILDGVSPVGQDVVSSGVAPVGEGAVHTSGRVSPSLQGELPHPEPGVPLRQGPEVVSWVRLGGGLLGGCYLWYQHHWLHATGWRKPRSLKSLFLIILANHVIAMLAGLLTWAYLATFREFLE
jgi:hypothetical protein